MTTQHTNHTNNSLVISYLTLRKSIGILGIIFPVVLVIGSFILINCNEVQHSISSYYHTVMRDIFVAIVFTLGIFLFTYEGYDKKDRIACKLAAIFAIGIALCPTQATTLLTDLPSEDIKSAFAGCSFPSSTTNPLISKLHLIFAALFFLTLTYISIFLFTKSDKQQIGKQKKKRNIVYITCGIIMFGCILSIAIYFLFLDDGFPNLKNYKPVFYLESAALVAFGVSWLTKGEAIFKDAVEES